VQRPGGDWEFDWKQVEKQPLTLPFITVPTEFSREAIRDRTLRMVRRKALGVDSKAAVLEKKIAAEEADNEQWRSVLASLAGCADYETWAKKPAGRGRGEARREAGIADLPSLRGSAPAEVAEDG
jgi:hypothetical protein